MNSYETKENQSSKNLPVCCKFQVPIFMHSTLQVVAQLCNNSQVFIEEKI